MILRVFAVRDSAVNLFMPPIFLRSDGEAKRALRLTLDGDHAFAKSPSDYSLWCLGEFDEETGTFHDLLGKPIMLCPLIDLMEK